ncbi:hydroxyacid dehydrogenase [Orrella sp. 11846]|uniref:hydroxyacid dehydrogenase n=1 Tax=Orrella sp. 11846 TaxID=3409913 RepID=UPI003B5C68EE
MTINVARQNRWIDPCFDDMIRNETNLTLSILDTNLSLAEAAPLLETIDVYHLGASRSETPEQWHITEELLAKWPRLKVLSSMGAGYDILDVDACTRAGVLVVNQAGGNANSVAEHTIGMMLTLAHRISECDHVLRIHDRGVALPRETLMGNEVKGKTIGLIGIGHIGTRVAQIAQALGMTILVSDPYVDPQEIERRGGQSVSFEELLNRSDIISVHCPRTQETVNLFDAQAFAAMKQGAIFISTARGGIHDEAALYDTLDSKHLSGAGLDVWVHEPPPLDHPLLSLPNVLSSYHTAGVTHEGRENVARIGAEQIIAICRGQTPPRAINPEVLEHAQARLLKDGA